ncbi:hypothetical protein Asd1617_06036 [Shigella dysenteriae 1617]|uniref:Uncharacterized protein n=1 Tax=Shigella dysenteriae 1617 TaxID=754093 RepID=A0A0A7A3F9_SHIDY|nr:hypothetical protein Asd1617_06036 [Shigella dysenteriae 1617]
MPVHLNSKNIIRWLCLKKEQMVVSAIASTPHTDAGCRGKSEWQNTAQ